MHQPTKTVLAVGASGRFAKHVVSFLSKAGISVRGLVRDETSAVSARKNGAKEVAFGDLRIPSSLDAAMHKVDGVFHIGPAFVADESELGLNMIDAAKRADVKKFVFSSVIQPTYAKLPNHASKIPVEEALFESGLEYTILRPTNFYQNIESAWKTVIETGAFGEPFSKTARVARVDIRDVAECVAIAFNTDRLAYGAFDLCADGSPNREEIAAMMSDSLSRPIEAMQPNFNDWALQTKLPYDVGKMNVMRQVNLFYDEHGSQGNSLILNSILGRPPRTLQAFIRDLAHAARHDHSAKDKSD